jgi:hypothetical protein
MGQPLVQDIQAGVVDACVVGVDVAVVTVRIYLAAACNGHTDAAIGGIAGVGGTDIRVIADDSRSRLAFTVNAKVTRGAGVVVIAVGKVVGMGATGLRQTRVICACVVVIAIWLLTPHTLAIGAEVHECALVAVVARSGVGGKETPALGIASVIGADIVI